MFSSVTFTRKPRSRRSGIRGHLQPETPVIFAGIRNHPGHRRKSDRGHPQARRARNRHPHSPAPERRFPLRPSQGPVPGQSGRRPLGKSCRARRTIGRMPACWIGFHWAMCCGGRKAVHGASPVRLHRGAHRQRGQRRMARVPPRRRATRLDHPARENEGHHPRHRPPRPSGPGNRRRAKRVAKVFGRRGFVFPSPTGGKHIGRESIEKVYRVTLKLEGKHSPHGWRSAFSTLARDQGFARDVVEIELTPI